MATANPRGVMVFSMAGMAVVLCGGLMVLMEYYKTEFKIRKGGTRAVAAGPTGPFAAKIKDLSPEAYSVTQGAHDQPEFFGKFVRFEEPGVYVDAVSGDPLFTSVDKLKSTHGQAEFSKPADPLLVEEKEEKSADSGEVRIQVYSKAAHTYLGWVATDDPEGGRRYVINSHALQFVRVERLESNGLERFLKLFLVRSVVVPKETGGAP